MKKQGLVSISFREHSPEKIISEAKKAGLSCIEWGSDVHAKADDTDTLRKIALLQKENGIFCSSYGTYFRLEKNSTDELQQYIDAAKILGTDILRLWCGTKNSGEYSENEEAQLIAECKKAAEIAEKNGVVLCLECHNGTYTDTKEGAIKLMKSVNSPFFRMYWQPNQFRTAEENKEYARLLASFTRVIHVFNWEGDNRYPLIDATEIWKEYLSFFHNTDIFLLEFMPDNSIASLEAEADALRKITE